MLTFLSSKLQTTRNYQPLHVYVETIQVPAISDYGKKNKRLSPIRVKHPIIRK